MLAAAGLAVSAQAGVEEIVWVEIDNSVGTMGDVVGEPTGLVGVRTFDLYAVVSPDTRIWVADFGFVGDHKGHDDNLWTTQSVYQHEHGGDVQMSYVGNAAVSPALEFDTYVGLGMLDSKIVMNTTILGGDWSPAMFQLAWYGAQFDGDFWMPAVGDDDGRVFLARISVESLGGYGDATGDDEWLGGRLFISGEDDRGEFGQADPESGLFLAPNAFPEPAGANIAGSNGSGPGGGGGSEAVDEALLYDVNGDGALDMQDLLQLQQNLGLTDGQMDFNGDGIVDALDVEMMIEMLSAPGGFQAPGADEPEDPTAGMTDKERKKYEKAQRKAEKQAAKAAAKEQKRLEKERRKEAKRLEKERKEREERGGTL